jgi:hypothetical protein
MILQALGTGYRRVRTNLRLVALAWAVNAALALLLALPFLNQLDAYIAPTANEEQLLLRFDMNWYRTFEYDMRLNPAARLFDLSTFGAAPFVHQLDGMISGGVVRTIGGTLWSMATTFRFRPGALDALALLALAYSLVGMFFAAGFVTAYASPDRTPIARFTAGAAKYFGPFFRLSLIGFILLYLPLVVVGKGLGDLIASSTENDASEWTAYVLHLGKNVVLLAGVWVVGLVLDYAKVRLVLDERAGAIDACVAALRFLRQRMGAAVRLSLVFVVLTIALMALYAVVVALVPQSSYAMILLMVVVQQAVVATRMFLKAGTYASEVALVRATDAEEGADR